MLSDSLYQYWWGLYATVLKWKEIAPSFSYLSHFRKASIDARVSVNRKIKKSPKKVYEIPFHASYVWGEYFQITDINSMRLTLSENFEGTLLLIRGSVFKVAWSVCQVCLHEMFLRELRLAFFDARSNFKFKITNKKKCKRCHWQFLATYSGC